ncbi:helix-turn-helix domain-containing protein [Paenibacillus apiarius]|uniref:XRE family transcriptional regulator n=1 Tax=Paenibacillus apiarius TaxID=46240 RepID=A0ABT4DWA4_9BACL|nr:XRE family transcriptional regulator [Paenibacillus apiarius]MCY9517712.1 XRE family transcriptional regulator [Paenibacillus apiarius]MCY9521635.1 XRE family transcriptional regulator [Paenibacillus apiarius]MCY9555313.1 XRE family transcriptional regulator [Paenibacillus apiarius]MCY9561193.1 XRE family transcriptional regulator [Paenibacillus apiarius]MCY9686336.1 XRE family transcriptional regulator [Paenibacillus apiarius]
MGNIDIGKKVEKYRKAKGLSSRELAKLAEITPSMLSQIERGLANPSIQTLKVLGKTLDVPTFSFLLEETNTDDLIVRSSKRKKMIIGNLSYELLSPDFTGNLATAIMNVPPNTSSSEKLLEHRGEEVAFILEGKIRVYLDEEEYLLEAGDSVKIPANLKHKWENNFSQNAVVLFSVTPPAF